LNGCGVVISGLYEVAAKVFAEFEAGAEGFEGFEGEGYVGTLDVDFLCFAECIGLFYITLWG
jgi:hypothetical protein